jgi:hypothetical protein
MQFGVKHCAVVLTMLAVAAPVWGKTYKQTLTLEKDKTIGSTQLKAGAYDFAADDAKQELNISQKGKAVATVPGQWTKIPKKSPNSTIVTDADKITEVDFGGSDQVFQPK